MPDSDELLERGIDGLEHIARTVHDGLERLDAHLASRDDAGDNRTAGAGPAIALCGVAVVMLAVALYAQVGTDRLRTGEFVAILGTAALLLVTACVYQVVAAVLQRRAAADRRMATPRQSSENGARAWRAGRARTSATR